MRKARLELGRKSAAKGSIKVKVRKPWPGLELRGVAVGATLQRLRPLRLSLCGSSLTSSPRRIPRKAW